jgi:hypothetical protein
VLQPPHEPKGDTAITALDTVVYQGNKYVAVGLNRYGVRILDGNTLQQEVLSLYGNWGGSWLWEADTVSAVKFGVDDSGRLLLATGKFTYNDDALYVANALTGEVLWTNNYRKVTDKWQWASALLFGRFGPNNKVILAAGWPEPGRVSFLNASEGNEFAELRGSENLLPVAFRFFANAEGKNVLGVVRKDPSGNESLKNHEGALVGMNGAGGVEVLVESTVQDLVGRFVPGYRSVVLNVVNRAREGVQFQLFSGVSSVKGCWLNRELVGGSPFSARAVTVEVGGVSPSYGVGEFTAGVGEQGGCGSAVDGRGVFFGEVVLPDGSGRQVVKVVVEGNDLKVVEQGGDGRFVVGVAKTGSGGLLGAWTLTVREQYGAGLSVETVPVVTGKRLTPAPVEGYKPTDEVDDPSRPVFRFMVSGVGWRVPGAGVGGLAEAVLPAMRVQGSVDGEGWVDLGALIPGTVPSRVGDVVTLGDATFDWQTGNSPGAPNYTYFRVGASAAQTGDNTFSTPVNTDSFSAPEPSTDVGSIVFSSGGSSVRPNGLDQIPSRFSLLNENHIGLDPGFPAYSALYDRVYFRDSATKSLLTGLSDPKKPKQLVTVSPLRGAYPNDSIQLVADSRSVYLSTTNPDVKVPAAIFKPTGKDAKTVIGWHPAITSDTSPLKAEATPDSVGGFRVRPCHEGMCALAKPTDNTPVLFAVGVDTIGLQLRTHAATGSISFPLGDKDHPAEKHALGLSSLNIIGSIAHLANINSFGSGTFTTTIVTHGDLLRPADLTIGKQLEP